jgi:hypothetical protein
LVVVVVVVVEKKKETLTPPDDELREIAGWGSPIGFGSQAVAWVYRFSARHAQ